MVGQRIHRRATCIALSVLLACGGKGSVETAAAATTASASVKKKILFFVAYQNGYYSEYKVAYEALRAVGYEVDVRSAATGSAESYTASGDIEATANSLAGSSYAAFTAQFQNYFGSAWQSAWNATPTTIPVNGRIQDVTDMTDYVALVSAGGTGTLDYRVDGSYPTQTGPGGTISAATVQAVAEKLNSLALNALQNGKPIYFQCHAASLPVFFRIPGTEASGAEALGISLLKNQEAAGYPEAQTATDYTTLSVTRRDPTLNKVVVSSPNAAFTHNGNADFKIITQADWYPQSVAHGTRTLINILDSYPTKATAEANKTVLILHGGALDTANCAFGDGGFSTNDVPCNYTKTVSELPADYTHVAALLNADSPNDAFSFTVTGVNLTSTGGAFNVNDKNSVLSYLNQFKAVIFFKHWSSGVTTQVQDALVEYADTGGGVLGLHHAMYNDTNYGGSNNKNILRDSLFGVVSEAAGWSASLQNFNLIATNHGHFVTTYGISYSAAAIAAPGSWPAGAIQNAFNTAFSGYQNFAIYDEIYNNMQFIGTATYGRGQNQITPLFSNSYATQTAQMHTSGFVKLFNPSSDSTVGRVAYFAPGERRTTIDVGHRFGQVVRNAVVWVAKP